MKNSRKAFTLVETLVAITVLTLAVAGPLVVANRAILAARTARDQLTASYLAQEGVEYARFMRDYEFLQAFHAGGASVSATAWSNFISGSDSGSMTRCRSSTCTLDPTLSMGTGAGHALSPCSGGSCTALFQLASGVYSQSGGAGAVQTQFVRTLQLVDSGSGANAVSKVSWTYHGVPYTVTVSDHLNAWQ
jgi:prepilin-type N-terminal cleavage/methylation domain-containing protein